MFANLAPVLAPVFLTILFGYLWARAGQPFDRDLVSRLVMAIGAPCLIVATLDQAPLSLSALARVVLVYALVLAGTVVLGLACLRLLGLAWRTWFNALAFPNVGNMGLPLCLLAFGEQGLALGLAWFMVNSLLHFTVGPLVASGERGGPGLLFQPVIGSVVLALLMIITGVTLPTWLANTVELVGGFTIPLMLLTLGAALHGLPLGHLRVGLVVACLRLSLGLLVGLLVCLLLGLEGVLRGVVLVQSSMPVAVFNYLFAERYAREPSALAASVLLSTLLAFVVLVPLLAWLLPAG